MLHRELYVCPRCKPVPSKGCDRAVRRPLAEVTNTNTGGIRAQPAMSVACKLQLAWEAADDEVAEVVIPRKPRA